MPRRSKRTPATPVALVGSGGLAIKAAKTHLAEFIEKHGEILWFLPFSEDNTESHDAVVDALVEEGARFVLVSDDSIADDQIEEAAEGIEGAEGDAHRGAILGASEAREDGGPYPAVLSLVDEAMESDLDLVELASTHGMDTFDLCAGLGRVVLGDDADTVSDGPEEEEEEQDEAPEEPKLAPVAGSFFGVPDEVLEAVSAGDIDTAAEELKKLPRKDLVEVAASYNLEIAKGTHRKTIAEQIVEALMDRDAIEPEKPQEKPKRSPRPEAAPEAEEAPEEDQSEPVVEDPALTDEETALTEGAWGGLDSLVFILKDVAVAQGLEEAREFLEFLREEKLV